MLGRIVLLLVLAVSWADCHAPAGESGRDLNPSREQNPCATTRDLNDPIDMYMHELLARMIRMDRVSVNGGGRHERIVASERVTLYDAGPHLSFNITALSDNDNVTMALVLVVTGRRAPCGNELRRVGRRRIRGPYHCESNPFHIPDLAIYNVTHSVLRKLGQARFSVYASRTRRSYSASLVVFNDIDIPALMNETHPTCFVPVHPRERRRANTSLEVRSRRGSTQRAKRRLSGRNHRRNRLFHLQVKALRKKGWSSRRDLQLSGQSDELEQDEHRREIIDNLRRQIPTLQRQRFKDSRMPGSRSSTGRENQAGRPARKGSKSRRRRKHSAKRPKEPQRTRKVRPRRVGSKRSSPTGHKSAASGTTGSAFNASATSVKVTESGNSTSPEKERSRRSATGDDSEGDANGPAAGGCRLKPLELHPFYDLQLTGFISPTMLSIGKCEGECQPLLLPGRWVNRYSYIMSLLHVRGNIPVPPPACRPQRFQSFTVMFNDDNGNVVVERWYNARVIECACV